MGVSVSPGCDRLMGVRRVLAWPCVRACDGIAPALAYVCVKTEPSQILAVAGARGMERRNIPTACLCQLALHLTAARLFVPLPVCQSEAQQLLARAGGMERNGTERNGTSRAAPPAFVGSGSILRSRPVFCLQQLYAVVTLTWSLYRTRRRNILRVCVQLA